jgi:hypothetical protein
MNPDDDIYEHGVVYRYDFDHELSVSELAGDYEAADPDDYELRQAQLLDFDPEIYVFEEDFED